MMKIDDREFEIVFIMKDYKTICVKASKNAVDNVYKLHRDLDEIKGNIILDFDGKLIDLKEVDYFRWYAI
nr:MAG TPA: hypothetical protein [Caudoviricetes sp.]